MRGGGSFEELQSLVTSHGYRFDTCPVDAVALRGISADLDLRPRFTSLYIEHGPADRTSIPWVVEDMLLFSFNELSAAQAGYRWVGADRASSSSWRVEWVVIASIFGDPFFIDTSKDASPVLFARHGAGTWSPIEIASAMELFIGALVEFERVLLEDFDLDVWGDDGLLPDFVREVERKVADVLTVEQASSFAVVLA